MPNAPFSPNGQVMSPRFSEETGVVRCWTLRQEPMRFRLRSDHRQTTGGGSGRI